MAKEYRKAYREGVYCGRPVPGFGDRGGRIPIVGLAPGAHCANRTGRLFTGDSSGQFLYSALHRVGIASRPDSRHSCGGMELRDAFLSVACRCAPPANKPSREEQLACRSFLAREIALLPDLRVTLALGWIALETVVQIDWATNWAELQARQPAAGNRTGMAFKHAAEYRLGAAAPWLVASFHPSRQNTQTGRLTPAMCDEVWERARKLLGGGDAAG